MDRLDPRVTAIATPGNWRSLERAISGSAMTVPGPLAGRIDDEKARRCFRPIIEFVGHATRPAIPRAFCLRPGRISGRNLNGDHECQVQ